MGGRRAGRGGGAGTLPEHPPLWTRNLAVLTFRAGGNNVRQHAARDRGDTGGNRISPGQDDAESALRCAGIGDSGRERRGARGEP
ncbi:hypothetical protein FRACA_830006 [Frankia canadensis]|uniref:Uncharacterized protein n=1 Tax=Frankia canadensis TaxID=1836972 RepID=A0A2I2L1P1_9ACTN|nr:hypothetical protein FRACA_830006 [Frankia canadensis]SOU59133.1 hypothetical protein FRACA_830006 [Frankia canadensis]